MINIGIIFGGESVEHEISIISALQAIDYIDKTKYNAIPIYISKDRLWYTGDKLLDINNYKDLDSLLKKCKEVVLCKKNNEYCLISNKYINKVVKKLDIAFPIVHGANVEDGSLAGYLSTLGIPYVGSKLLASSIGQDKVVTKEVLMNNNIPVVPYIWFYESDFINNKEYYLNKIKELDYPVIVKPATLGSSVGINIVKKENMVIDAINEALMYDKKIIVEKCIENLIEVNASVLGNYEDSEVSILERVNSNNDYLTYEDKYIGSSKGIVNTNRIIPADISDKLTKEITNTSKEVFRVLNFSGVVRIDYLIDSKTNNYYVNEPNTIPGSLSYYLWQDIGYKELLNKLIDIAIKEYKDNKKRINSLNTNILKDYNELKSVKK